MTTPLPTLDRRRSFGAGARTIAPVLLGIVPFGLVAGVATVDAGLGLAEAVGFSVVVFAGASQLAALELIGSGSPLWVILVTAVVINARMVMYSASLSPWVTDQPLARRGLMAYLLTDQAFAFSVARYQDPTSARVDRFAFYLGVGGVVWVVWQLATIAGVYVGAAVPPQVPLGFAVPLAFLAMLVPAVTDRPTLLAALVGAGVSVAAAPLPANLGLLLGAVSGVLAGFAAARRAHPGGSRSAEGSARRRTPPSPGDRSGEDGR